MGGLQGGSEAGRRRAYPACEHDDVAVRVGTSKSSFCCLFQDVRRASTTKMRVDQSTSKGFFTTAVPGPVLLYSGLRISGDTIQAQRKKMSATQDSFSDGRNKHCFVSRSGACGRG